MSPLTFGLLAGIGVVCALMLVGWGMNYFIRLSVYEALKDARRAKQEVRRDD